MRPVMMRIWTLLLAGAAGTLLNLGASHAYDQDTQAWLSLQAQGAFAEGGALGVYLEATARASSEQKAVHERYFRPALTYRSKIGTLFLGTMFRYDEESEQVERRHWLQWSNSYEVEALRVSVRLRQELRELRGVAIPVYRSRAQVRLQHEALKIGQSVMPYVSQELLFNLNDARPSTESGLVQSRTGVGVNLALSEDLAFDVGYLGVVSNQATRDDQFLHVLNMTVQYRF